MLRSSVARIVLSSIGISYCLPVRLSVTVRVSADVATPPPSVEFWVSVVIALLNAVHRRPPLVSASGRRRPWFQTLLPAAVWPETPAAWRSGGENRRAHGEHDQHEREPDDAPLPGGAPGDRGRVDAGRGENHRIDRQRPADDEERDLGGLVRRG